MKMKLLLVGLSLGLLTSCGVVNKTVVVDQEGNVIETKSSAKYNYVPTGEYLRIEGVQDYPIYQHTDTGCKYVERVNGMTALHNEYGQVEGCRKNL